MNFNSRLGLFIFFFILLLFNFVVPVHSGEDQLYSAVTKFELVNVSQQTPFTSYVIQYELELWNEYQALNLSAEILGIDEGTCLFQLVINTTNDIKGSSNCVFYAYNFDAGLNSLDKGNNAYLVRDGLYVNETDYEGINFPDGNITFSFLATEYVPSDYMGISYNATFMTTNRVNTIYQDPIPQEYGTITNKSFDFLNPRVIITKASYISPINVTSTKYQFDVTSEILNRGEEFSQGFPTTCTEGIELSINVTGMDSFYSPAYGGCGDTLTLKTYPARLNVVYEYTIYLKIHDFILYDLPDGDIRAVMNSQIPISNMYGAKLTRNNGIITTVYDKLPDWWTDYKQESNNEFVDSEYRAYTPTVSVNTNSKSSEEETQTTELKVNIFPLISFYLASGVILYSRKQLRSQ